MTWTKSAPTVEPLEGPRTHEQYKRRFVDRLNAEKGSSVLDVGCGDGSRLRELGQAGWERCVGLEVDPDAAAQARQAGIEVHEGRGEALPFSDGSFDIVIFEYTTHHLEHLQQALIEAARVARTAVHVLDCWYDRTIPSQRTAESVDLWIKRLDRRRGLVHNRCPEATELAAPFAALGGHRIDYAMMLDLRPLPISRLAEMLEAQLSDFPAAPDLAIESARLVDEAREVGLSDDGAMLFSAVKADRRPRL